MNAQLRRGKKLAVTVVVAAVFSVLGGVTPIASSGAADLSPVLFAGSAGNSPLTNSRPGIDRVREFVLDQDQLSSLVSRSLSESTVGSLTAQFFDGKQVTFKAQNVTSSESGADSEMNWFGEYRDDNGKLISWLGLSVNRDQKSGLLVLSGLYQTGSGLVAIEPPGEGGPGYRMVERDSSEVTEMPDGVLPAQKEPIASGTGKVTTGSMLPATQGGFQLAGAGAPSTPVIRVLVAFADGTYPYSKSYIANTMVISQTIWALTASGIDATVQLAGTMDTNYDPSQEPGDMTDDLGRLETNGDGKMDDVYAQRSALGADLVMLMEPEGSANYCGLSHVPSQDGYRNFGYSITALDYPGSSCSPYTATHELGHDLGAGHAPSGTNSHGTFGDSYGHYVTNSVRGVMVYPNSCGTCVEDLRFSNPAKTFTNTSYPSGTSTRNNAFAMSYMVWVVSAYEKSTNNDSMWRGQTNRTFSSASPQDQTQPMTPLGGDFNGNSNGDIFWYVPGEPSESAWYFDNGLNVNEQYPGNVSGDYDPIVGDFDGDGFDDIFWYAPGGSSDTIWWGRLGTISGTGATTNTVNGTYQPFVGDFDGNGADDVFWYAPGSGYDNIWWGGNGRSGFGSSSTPKTVSGTYRPVTGDFNGDSYDDLFWYGPQGTSDTIWWGMSSHSSFSSSHSSRNVSGVYEPVAGNFDNDGYDDVFWYAPGTGGDSIWWGTSNGVDDNVMSPESVDGYYQPVVGDFDSSNGDGIYWYQKG